MSALGTLYLVATPIGNLEDITGRAVRVLREASVVACEDTRHTRGLLAHLGIRTPTLSLHEHNERARIPQILGLLREGRSVAVVSDAGTPAISDPGTRLVAAAVQGGFEVVPVPGASAVTAVVPLADFRADRFAFIGFLPAKAGERRRVLAALAQLPMALVLFEGPHRVRDTLADIESVLGPRRVVLARELTKVHEEVLRGTAAEVRAALSAAPRGEVTLLVEGADEGSVAGAGEAVIAAGSSPSGGRAQERASPKEFAARLVAQGLSRRDAAKALAEAYGLPSRDAYKIASGVV
ncbi:MAG: 16S rRNA (cytidine(1402)-2'-O)-methyltransferase [Armatimonadetes bacterium]|nr:16S rRNA (cytidine(1402)-2'-O)-methyltransferase [Armatimonadota bacterium]